MSQPQFLTTPENRRIAYRLHAGHAPFIVFLGGFKSDMQGTKARFLEGWARARGNGFLRFDYSGHGQSGGDFEAGAIGDWAADAAAVITNLTKGRVILVGSSMGGWISLILARKMPERLAGLVGIAAAPDFTEDSLWAGFSAEEQATVMRDGRIEMPSAYDDSPYVITKRMIEEGRDNLVLRTPLDLPFPVRFLQGSADRDVDVNVALRLFDHVEGTDVRLTLVKGANHRFSTPQNLRLIGKAIHSVERAAHARI